MSNICDFLLLIGSGHHYDTTGLNLHATIGLHRKKGGWLFMGETQTYWFNHSEPDFENALLMASLLEIAPKASDMVQMKSLQEKATHYFKSPYQELLHPSDEDTILPADLLSLKALNKKALSEMNVKFVAIDMQHRQSDEANPSKTLFLETLEAYQIKAFEYHQSVVVKGFDSFSKKSFERGLNS
ncbi:MAG: hypothetical protein QNL04_05360 [SAR324 cluster bacterium]|nr:hypothetical protein [SAR324 cluster bacterium]